jgi:dihydroxy-acid dehydratase
MTKIDKSHLPSRHVTEGPARAPHRSYFYAMGISEEEIKQPWVGVATCWNEAAPCNISLNRQAQAVKMGVKSAQGTPREFTTITVTDGIAMGHEGMRSSLASREAIADTVELTMRGHCYDALVGLAGCDKSLPGMMMAMVRLNTPSVFIYGGSILPGRLDGKDVTVQDVFEAVGQHQAGNYSDEQLAILERVACPSAGACGGQFTANTMACVSEAIGLALPNSSGAPAPYESRDSYGEASGVAVMNLIEKNIRARDIVTRRSLENAARIVACTGGSTNAGLHLPAIAHEAGIDFDLDDVCDIFRETPYFVDLKPGGQYVAKDLYEAGGVPVVLNELRKAGLIHEDCMTVTGHSMGEELDRITRKADGKVIFEVETPITPTGGVVGLKGNLAPEGAIVKVAGIPTQHQRFVGPARVFESEEEAFEAVKARTYKEGEVLVIRNEGPAGGPGMREMLATTAALSGQGMGKKVALITDGRFSGATRGSHGGPIATLIDGDIITIDATTGELSVNLTDDELAERKENWKGPKETIYASGALWKYARLVGSAKLGACTHPGAKEEKHVYMDL